MLITLAFGMGSIQQRIPIVCSVFVYLSVCSYSIKIYIYSLLLYIHLKFVLCLTRRNLINNFVFEWSSIPIQVYIMVVAANLIIPTWRVVLCAGCQPTNRSGRRELSRPIWMEPGTDTPQTTQYLPNYFI